MRALVPVVFLFATGICSAGGVHYLDLVNTAPSSVVAFAVADSGSGAFRDVPLGNGVQGGGDATTIAIRGDGCLRDLRAVFKDGRVLVQKDFDVCKYRSYHTGQYLRRGEAPALVAKLP